MATIKITDASTDQLRQYAKMSLGIDNLSANPKTGAEALIARIRAAGHTSDEITVPDVDVDASVSGTPPQNPNAPDRADEDGDYVTIFIHEAPEGETNDPVFVAVNGRGMLIERGKESRVRRCFAEALDHAKRYIYDPDPKGGLGKPREAHMYPFSIRAA